MKTIAITGGSGFTGRRLAEHLLAKGYRVIIFSRSAKRANEGLLYQLWNPEKKEMDTSMLPQVDAIINLAGTPVAEGRWNAKRKKEIASSRTDVTRFLVQQLREHAPVCRTFIAASATGFYGPDNGMGPFKEADAPDDDFLAKVCVAWEAASGEAASFYRTVIFRFGIILGKDGGAYPLLSRPINFGVMPILGTGRQMVSWLHVEDLSAMIEAAIGNEEFRGIYNAVSPHPLPHKDLMRAIARAKGGFKIPVHVPPFVLRIIMGESRVEVLKSCTVSAGKILDTGFVFRYPKISEAARALAHQPTLILP